MFLIVLYCENHNNVIWKNVLKLFYDSLPLLVVFNHKQIEPIHREVVIWLIEVIGIAPIINTTKQLHTTPAYLINTVLHHLML